MRTSGLLKMFPCDDAASWLCRLYFCVMMRFHGIMLRPHAYVCHAGSRKTLQRVPASGPKEQASWLFH